MNKTIARRVWIILFGTFGVLCLIMALVVLSTGWPDELKAVVDTIWLITATAGFYGAASEPQ